MTNRTETECGGYDKPFFYRIHLHKVINYYIKYYVPPL